MLLNATVETTQLDEQTAAMVRAEVDNLEQFFRHCVTRARKQSATEGGPSPTATARLLVAALAGISALSRAATSRRALEDVARAALSLV
jgi:hypothetical protein